MVASTPLLPLAIFVPSGLKDTLSTPHVCPVNVFIFSPVETSHKRTVLSRNPPPLASVLPSGLKDTLWTRSVCPLSRATS